MHHDAKCKYQLLKPGGKRRISKRTKPVSSDVGLRTQQTIFAQPNKNWDAFQPQPTSRTRQEHNLDAGNLTADPEEGGWGSRVVQFGNEPSSRLPADGGPKNKSRCEKRSVFCAGLLRFAPPKIGVMFWLTRNLQ